MPVILIAESLCTETMNHVIKQEGGILHYDLIEKKDDQLHFVYQPDISVSQIEAQIEKYDAIIVRPKQVTKQAIENAKKLKLIVRGGAGVNAIDCVTAKQRGIIVENTPGLNSVATAEYSFALIMELLARRHIHAAYKDSINNAAKQPEYYAGYELAGKHIGVVGYGNIGSRLVKRCLAFDMKVSVYNRTKKQGDFDYYHHLEDLFKQDLDIVSLHVPLTEDTVGIINYELLNVLPKPITLINTARPQLVDVESFCRALGNGIIANAGIDGDEDVIAPFIRVDKNGKCLITPHIADSTYEAQRAIAQQVVIQTARFLLNGEVVNRVV